MQCQVGWPAVALERWQDLHEDLHATTQVLARLAGHSLCWGGGGTWPGTNLAGPCTLPRHGPCRGLRNSSWQGSRRGLREPPWQGSAGASASGLLFSNHWLDCFSSDLVFILDHPLQALPQVWLRLSVHKYEVLKA